MLDLIPTLPGLPDAAGVIAPTPHDVRFVDGTARLLRFRPRPQGLVADRLPVVLVPSLINRWYIMDLRRQASVAEALVEVGLDVWLLDWGVPRDEDRHLSWDDVLVRLSRMLRRVRRLCGVSRTGVLGYCLGGTLSGIHTALEPDGVAALANLAGPFDFAHAGRLGEMTDPRWFDAEAVASAGNLGGQQMQSAFVALRPTSQLAKWVGLAERGRSEGFREAFVAMEAWANDNIAFPAAAYVTYIRELYQHNRLVAGEHSARGRQVSLDAITCPVLTIGASADTICPLEAATGLNRAVSSADNDTLVVPGGHVGAVVGSRAQRELYPALGQWFLERLALEPSPPAPLPDAASPLGEGSRARAGRAADDGHAPPATKKSTKKKPAKKKARD